MTLFEFIEGWYNRKKIHSAIGYQIPYDIKNVSIKIPRFCVQKLDINPKFLENEI